MQECFHCLHFSKSSGTVGLWLTGVGGTDVSGPVAPSAVFVPALVLCGFFRHMGPEVVQFLALIAYCPYRGAVFPIAVGPAASIAFVRSLASIWFRNYGLNPMVSLSRLDDSRGILGATAQHWRFVKELECWQK